MKPRKPIDPADNWHWRVNRVAPGGEWIDSSVPPPVELRRARPRAAISELPEVATGGWLVSSVDLLSGIDVVDGDADEVPANVFDELFPRHRSASDPQE